MSKSTLSPFRHPPKKYTKRELTWMFAYLVVISLGLSLCGIVQLPRVDGFCLIGVAVLLMVMYAFGASLVDKTDAEESKPKESFVDRLQVNSRSKT